MTPFSSVNHTFDSVVTAVPTASLPPEVQVGMDPGRPGADCAQAQALVRKSARTNKNSNLWGVLIVPPDKFARPQAKVKFRPDRLEPGARCRREAVKASSRRTGECLRTSARRAEILLLRLPRPESARSRRCAQMRTQICFQRYPTFVRVRVRHDRGVKQADDAPEKKKPAARAFGRIRRMHFAYRPEIRPGNRADCPDRPRLSCRFRRHSRFRGFRAWSGAERTRISISRPTFPAG